MKIEKDPGKRRRLMIEIAQTAALTLLIFLAIHLTIQNFTIDGTSMEPNLHNTELMLVDRWTYRFHPPTRGDIIVFKAPPDPAQNYVKRVIGLPGDVITIRGTTVLIDGVELHETYVNPGNQGIPQGAHPVVNLRVPKNDYFVLGDNRAVSDDSRIWGFLPKQNVIGRAALVYWPFGQSNDGFLPNVASVFDGIHANKFPRASLVSTLKTHANLLFLLIFPILFLLYLKRTAVKRWFLSYPPTEAESGS